MPRKTSSKFDFEKSLNQLTTLIEQMESENITLEESLKQFESGIQLIRQCQQALKQAEQKVEVLTEQGKKTFDPNIND